RDSRGWRIAFVSPFTLAGAAAPLLRQRMLPGEPQSCLQLVSRERRQRHRRPALTAPGVGHRPKRFWSCKTLQLRLIRRELQVGSEPVRRQRRIDAGDLERCAIEMGSAHGAVERHGQLDQISGTGQGAHLTSALDTDFPGNMISPSVLDVAFDRLSCRPGRSRLKDGGRWLNPTPVHRKIRTKAPFWFGQPSTMVPIAVHAAFDASGRCRHSPRKSGRYASAPDKVTIPNGQADQRVLTPGRSRHSSFRPSSIAAAVTLLEAAEPSLTASSALRYAVAASSLSPRTTRERMRRVQPSTSRGAASRRSARPSTIDLMAASCSPAGIASNSVIFSAPWV